MIFNKLKLFIRAFCFLLIFAILFGHVQDILVSRAKMNYRNIAGFYEERENSLDAVYIGSSNCFVFWNSAFAWEEYGINVYPYACNSQSFFSAEYLIKETRKTQENALFIVNINTLTDGKVKMPSIHNLTTSMPFSLNKMALVHHLTSVGGYSFSDSLEYYLPIIRYHERWDELKEHDFGIEMDGLKGASKYSPYLYKSVDVSEDYTRTTKVGELSEEVLYSTNKLLDYCDKEKIKVLFVTVPQAKGAAMVKKYNALNKLIESRGYPVLSLINKDKEIGLDVTSDFYNGAHTNIHGSIKFTYYLSEYLIKNYGFKDKRNNKEYNDWNIAYENYMEAADSYVLSVELDSKHRNYELKAPKIKLKAEASAVDVTWQSVDGADGYAVFRKETYLGSWEQVTETSGLEFKDKDADIGIKYYYTVVPFSEKDNQKYYGEFIHNGRNITLQ